MKIKIIDLVNCMQTLTKLGNTEGLDINVAYDILSNIDVIHDSLNKFEKTKNKIALNYVTKDESGKPVTKDQKLDFTEENEKKLNNEIVKLLEREVKVDIVRIDLVSINAARLSPFELKNINFMLRKPNKK